MIAACVVLYGVGLLLIMLATPDKMWTFLVLSWVFLGVFAIAPLITAAFRLL